MKFPSYLNLSKKELQDRVKKAQKLLEKCSVCPRKCGVDRLKDEKGFCQVGKELIISSYSPHFGEESCLVGTSGSGTIFLTWCNLRCVYCQNYDISQLGHGHKVSQKELADIMIYLQNLGCHNINFVSPTHQVPQILQALPYAIEKGLKVPLVYNTNAYDSVDTLKLLDGIFDIYMPDTKYSDDKTAVKYSSAPNYFKIMKSAIKEMHRQVGDLVIKSKVKSRKLKVQPQNKNLENIPEGVALKGILVRHLVLPENIAGTEKIMKFLASLSKNTFVNIMDQYRPCHKAYNYPPLSRSITREEFNQAIKTAKKAGIIRIYTH